VKRIFFKILIIVVASHLFSGCGIYSFTGASIDPAVETISIKYFPNNAEMVIPTLSRSFTEKLQDYFASQTDLDLVERGGDLSFEGAIIGYNTVPKAIQGNETAALNRLTIKVEVKFVNAVDPSQNFETVFSEYEEYPSNASLNQVEQDYVPVIVDKLVEAIFNKAVVNW
jgi:hypothetical protein